MNTKIIVTLFGMMLALALSACAPTGISTGSSPTDANSIQITDVWARTVNLGTMEEETPTTMDKTPDAMGSHAGSAMAQQNGAVYMNIANTGAADRLLKAETEAANTVELHTVVQENGMMQMRPVDGIDVPANGSVQLKPGGFHVMLLGVNRELKAGDKINVKLTFDKAGVREIQAKIRAQ